MNSREKKKFDGRLFYIQYIYFKIYLKRQKSARKTVELHTAQHPSPQKP